MAQNELYTFIGCSQTARFDGAIYEPPQRGYLIVGKARWQPWQRAAHFFTGGRFDEYMTRIFIEMRVVKGCDTPREGPFSPVFNSPVFEQPTLVHYEPRPAHVGKVMCFEYGEADAADLALEFQGRYRFDVPHYAFPDNFPDDEPSAPEVSLAYVEARVRERAQPYFDGLLALREAGFRHVFFHDIPPANRKTPPGFTSGRLRHKLNILFNREFDAFSRATGIPLIRTWDELLIEGILNPRFARDPLHLNAEAAPVSLKAIHDILSQNRAGS